MEQIAPESKAFLIWLFTDLRSDLADQTDAGGPTGPDPENVARTTAIFDALLSALDGDGDLPDDERVREYVAELAKATDEENEYAQAALEHRALAELGDALAKRG